jgi:hypothetical protein
MYGDSPLPIRVFREKVIKFRKYREKVNKPCERRI